jgi:hypothetical protein
MWKLIVVAIVAFVLGMVWGAGIMSMLIVSQRRPPLPKAIGSGGKMERPVPWPDPPDEHYKHGRKKLKRWGITSSALEECD